MPVLPQQYNGLYLYKYGNINNPEYLRQIITENTIYHPKASELNDPEECRPLFADQPIEKILDYICEQHLIENPHASAERIEAIRSNGREIGKEQLMKDFRTRLYATMDNHYGIISLSKRRDNMHLWAHYGDNHQGYCLVFRNEGIHATEVRYSDKVPFKLSSNIDDSRVSFLVTKKPDWSSEEEVRIVASPPGVASFPPGLLTSVILGKDISSNNKTLVLGWAQERAIPLELLQASFNSSTHEMEFSVIV